MRSKTKNNSPYSIVIILVFETMLLKFFFSAEIFIILLGSAFCEAPGVTFDLKLL